MNTAALKHDDLRPRRPKGMGRGFTLAVLVHVGLVIAIAFSVHWRSSDPAGVSAELWAAVPQVAAPAPAEPEPKPEPPKPKPPEPVPPKPEPVQKVDDAQIAIEKAKREEDKRKEELKRQELERQKEEQQRKQAELERKKKEAEDQRKREVAAAAAAEKARQQQIDRMAALAGAAGGPTSTGTAARTAGPSATYAGRIKAAILPNILFNDTVDGNPMAVVEVRAAPDGTIIGQRLIKSSGVKSWDDAVLRAVDKTAVLPRDTDGRVPSSFEIAFRVRDQ